MTATNIAAARIRVLMVFSLGLWAMGCTVSQPWTGRRDSNEMPAGQVMLTELTRVSGASAFHHETAVSQDGTS
jgi:hypothetical protein